MHGRLKVPGDKSISHRAVMLGAVAQGHSKVEGALMGDDVLNTIGAFRACGVDIRGDETQLLIDGVGLRELNQPRSKIDCGNSGTAIRLLTGLFAGQPHLIRLVGDDSLSKRPMRRIVDPLDAMGARIELSENGTPPVVIRPSSKLQPIQWTLPVASAQVKSAVLLAGLYCDGETTVIEPEVTRDHTEIMLRSFGCPVRSENRRISLRGGAELHGQSLKVPSDISSAAFFIAAALLIPGSDLTLTEVGINPTRTGLIEVLQEMGGSVELVSHNDASHEPAAEVRVRYTGELSGVSVDPAIIPRMIDEIPILAVVAAFAKGRTVLSGCEELRVKESDRIFSVASGLKALGVCVEERHDGLAVEGGQVKGGMIDSFGDHRIAMSFAIAGAGSDAEVQIRNCDCVGTSFPGFTMLARECGMNIEESLGT